MVAVFGEARTDLDRTIRGIAESRVLYLSRQEGRPVTDAWTDQVLGQHRRFFSALFPEVRDRIRKQFSDKVLYNYSSKFFFGSVSVSI